MEPSLFPCVRRRDRVRTVVGTLLLLVSSSALSPQQPPSAKNALEQGFSQLWRGVTAGRQRPALEKHVTAKLGQGVRVSWADDLATVPPTTVNDAVVASTAFWCWLADGAAGVLAFERVSERTVRRLVDLLEVGEWAGAAATPRLMGLKGAPPKTPALVQTSGGKPIDGYTGAHGVANDGAVDDALVTRRSQDWVQRTLVGLNLCPFTSSRDTAGVRLENYGIQAAPILFATSDADAVAPLLRDFWQTVGTFLEGGPEKYSSVILSAPHFDSQWDLWRDEVFPLLEENVVLATLTRSVGVVCFHPNYETPPSDFLKRHRFGHMYPPDKLRGWLLDDVEAGKTDADFAASVTDEQLQWAGSYQRRSPHAMINVLWAYQLEAAENRRSSRGLYSSNVFRLLQEGQRELDIASAEERESV